MIAAAVQDDPSGDLDLFEYLSRQAAVEDVGLRAAVDDEFQLSAFQKEVDDHLMLFDVDRDDIVGGGIEELRASVGGCLFLVDQMKVEAVGIIVDDHFEAFEKTQAH